jgi:WD40 repeat protein
VKVDHEDGSVLFDETGEGRLVRVDSTTHERRVLAELGEGLTSVAVMPGGKAAAVCGAHGRVAMVDLGAGVGAGTVRDLGKLPAACTVVHIVGVELRANDKDNRLLAWQYPSLAPVGNVVRAGTPPGPATRLGPSTHPKSRVAAIVEGGASIEDTATGEHELVPLHGLVSGGNLSPDENSAVFGFYDGRLVEWRVGRREVRELARLPGFVAATLVYSPDGTQLFATGANGAVVEVRIADGRVRRLVSHEARVATLVLSRSGKRLASGGADGEVRIVELASGAVQILRGHAAEVRWLDFVRDDLVVSMDAGGQFRLWNLRPEGFVPAEPAALAAWLARVTTARIQERGVTETAFPGR